MPPRASGVVANASASSTSSPKASGLPKEKGSRRPGRELGITWKPTPGGVFTRLHISDIWLDAAAMQNATQHQTETHKAFIRSRWMPAWVDAVEYGKFGRATVTATLFGGMDHTLYADFKPGITALMNSVENTLKHTEGGTAGPTQMAARGKLLDVMKVARRRPRSAAAASRSDLKPISSPKACAPRASSKSAPQAGPMSTCPAKSISATEPPASTSASPLPPSFRNTDPQHYETTLCFFVPHVLWLPESVV